jgi:Tol biopolymer transport system component
MNRMARFMREAIAMNSCCSTLLSCALFTAFFSWVGDAVRAQSAIFIMDVDGSNVEKVSHSDDRFLGAVAWSHDGKRLVYMGLDGPHKELYVETLGEGRPTHLGSGAAPCWSPDDEQIAFFQPEKNSAGARPGVWIMNSDGGGREWISEAIPGSRPSWSPTGDAIAFPSKHEGFASIYVFDTLELTRKRALGQGFTGIRGLAWSPDGKRLAFHGVNEGSGVLAVIDLGEEQPEILYRGRISWRPAWSPDGKTIAFPIRVDGEERLHLLDAEAGGEPVMIPGQFGKRNTDPAWSPDGKRIAFSSDRGP